ncbi:MAG: hypothetical protein K0Q50_546 [Vampirovibrio sp.]|jgi:hypothetical protein|nr:hypothetical protein [Vampirovibrio sp.]
MDNSQYSLLKEQLIESCSLEITKIFRCLDRVEIEPELNLTTTTSELESLDPDTALELCYQILREKKRMPTAKDFIAEFNKQGYTFDNPHRLSASLSASPYVTFNRWNGGWKLKH